MQSFGNLDQNGSKKIKINRINGDIIATLKCYNKNYSICKTIYISERKEANKDSYISDFSKIFKHLLPNVISLVIVNATLQMASAILTEAGLSFLGMGVTAPTPSWGNLMNLARDSYVFQNYPWEWMPAGLMCLLTVISINLIGEGLRDAFDPKELQ